MDKEPVKTLNHESGHKARNNADANSGSGGASLTPPKLDFSKSSTGSGKSKEDVTENGLRNELNLNPRNKY